MSCPYYKPETDDDGELTNICIADYDEESKEFDSCYCYGNELECEKKI